MNWKLLKVTAGVLCSVGFAGCIHQKSTVVQDVPRTRVEFENDAAARLFYEGFHRVSPRYNDTQTTKVSLPIVFHHERKVVTGPNGPFNRAVEICDTNRDGKITELEARIYNEQHCKRL